MDGYKVSTGQGTGLSKIYNSIDTLLKMLANVGCVAMIMLTLITVYDVATRYTSWGKDAISRIPGLGWLEGLNSTMLQESEFWAHTILFSLVMAYAITRQVHVRIDLVREMFGAKGKYILEIFGILVFLLPFSYIATRYCIDYAITSYNSGEKSPSTIGLTNFWILKSMLVVMFGSLFLAGISQLLKCIDGLRGKLDPEGVARVLGGDH